MGVVRLPLHCRRSVHSVEGRNRVAMAPGTCLDRSRYPMLQTRPCAAGVSGTGGRLSRHRVAWQSTTPFRLHGSRLNRQRALT